MEHAPFGQAAEKGLRRRRAGLDKTREFVLRFRRSETSNSRELYLSSAWISPDRSCESARVASVTPMRQNGGDEAGSGLLLWADGGRKAGSISAGRARVHGRGSTGPVVRPIRCLLQSTRGRRQSLYPAPRNVDPRWALASRVIPT